MPDEDNSSFGVFKPIGHVVISFPDAASADAAAGALERLGVRGVDDVHRYTDRQMLAQIDRDLQRASPLASIGQEVNLIKAHRERAERGYHWLVVRADGELARRVAECARSHGAERAQHYGHLVIEELIDSGGNQPQEAESPDRGLDAPLPGAAAKAGPPTSAR